MIRSLVLDALARAVDEAREDAARERLEQADPLLRPLARARLRGALREAWLSVHPEDGATHALRLAWLISARAVPDDPAPGPVEAAFVAARKGARPPTARWWASWVLGSLAVAAISAVALWVVLAPSNPRTSAAGRLFGKRLGAWVVALDRWGQEAQDGGAGGETTEALRKARADLLDGAPGAIGEAPAAALQALVERAEVVAGPDGADAGDAMYAAVGALDKALGEAHQPYFVDGEVLIEGGVRSAIVTSFIVERERRLRSGELSERLLRIRRFDSLNWTRSHLGYTRDTLDVALVAVDQVDGLVVTRILPSLAPGGAMPLTSRDERDGGAAWVAAVESRAGLVVREQLGAVPGLDAAGAMRAADLLSRRREALERARRDLRRAGVTFEDPETLALPDTLLEQLEGKATAEDLRELRRLDDELDDPAVSAAFDALHEALTVSVERHEAQHRLDLAIGEAFVVPAELRSATGSPADGAPPAWVRRSALELSAYLAEIARDDRTLQVNVALDARFVLNGDQWGTPESYAILVMLDAIAEEAGVARDDVTPGNVVRRGRVAARVIDLLDLPADSVREAAKRAWERLFERPLPPLEIGDA